MSTFSANGSPTCTAGRLVGPPAENVSDARMDAPPMPSPPVRAPNSTTLLPTPRRVGEVQVFVAQHADRERVDERVALVDRVEVGLAADVRQAEAVAVERDAGDDAVHDAGGVGVVDGAEAQLRP